MNTRTRWRVGLTVIGCALWLGGQKQKSHSAEQSASTSYEAEKAKALANPYPNDSGPASIDVSSYPPELQETYKNLLLVRCARCHQPSRPLNSQFVEPSGPKNEHQAKIAEWKKSHPEMFQ